MDPVVLVLTVVMLGIVLVLFYNNRTTTEPRSMLKLYAKDLTYLAQQKALDPVIGREHEISKVIEILSRRKKNNPLLVGRAGVGKTAIVDGLANAIAKGAVPVILRQKRVLSLDLSSLVAGTKYRGEFEKRLKNLLNEIIAGKRNIILFIDEIHSLAEAGGAEGAIGAEDILKPVLSDGELQLVGATTFSEYHKFIEPNTTMERRFQVVTINEPDDNEVRQILLGLRPRYEDFHKVKVSEAAIERIIKASHQVMPERVMPDKAIDLLDEACSKVKIERVENPAKNNDQEARVEPQHIDQVVADWGESLVGHETNV